MKSFASVRRTQLVLACSMSTATLVACGGGGSSATTQPTPATPSSISSAVLLTPASPLLSWSITTALTVALKDEKGTVVPAAEVTCTANDATQADVAADCSNITVRRVGDIAITVSGRGTSATLTLTGVPQKYWSGLHGSTSSEGSGDYNLITTSDGQLLAWGTNTYGVLGQNLKSSALASLAIPSPVLNTTGAAALASVYQSSAGSTHALALLQDGTVLSWGDSNAFALGRADIINGTTLPVSVQNTANTGPLQHVVQVEAGNESGVALIDDGSVVTWGSYPGGGSTTSSLPTKLLTPDGKSQLKQVMAVAAGTNFSLALTQDGKVYAWGFDLSEGRLGAGTVLSKSTSLPNTVKKADGTDLTGIVQIAAGYDFSLALAADGSVWAWGDNSQGQLGQNAQSYNGMPHAVQVKAPTGSSTTVLDHVAMVAAGGHHALALSDTGTVVAWGLGPNGQLGDGPTRLSGDYALLPFRVVSTDGTGILSDIASIAAGYEHSLALTRDGRVLSWGNYFSGALGRDTKGKYSPTPAPVQRKGGGDLILTPLSSYPNLLARAH